MDSRDLTLAQLDALFAKLAPMAHYLKKLENRMHHECYPADDELVEQASAAMHSLAIHTHYLAREKVTRLHGLQSALDSSPPFEILSRPHEQAREPASNRDGRGASCPLKWCIASRSSQVSN